jgi:lysophospholipase L1-like esterase
VPTTAVPSTTLVPPTVTAIGDSVMLGAVDALVQTIGPERTFIDAEESRQFSAGVDRIEQYKNEDKLGDDVVVQLGTNGTINPDDFDRMMGLLKGHKVLILNAKVPRAWEDQVNQVLADGVKRYKNAVLIDWHTVGGDHPEYFYDDGLHLRPEGAQAYAQLILENL